MVAILWRFWKVILDTVIWIWVRRQDRTSVAVVIAVDFVPHVPVADKNMSGRETRKHVPTSSNQGVKRDYYRVIKSLTKLGTKLSTAGCCSSLELR
jgi:hypothetical protein